MTDDPAEYIAQKREKLRVAQVRGLGILLAMFGFAVLMVAVEPTSVFAQVIDRIVAIHSTAPGIVMLGAGAALVIASLVMPRRSAR